MNLNIEDMFLFQSVLTYKIIIQKVLFQGVKPGTSSVVLKRVKIMNKK